MNTDLGLGNEHIKTLQHIFRQHPELEKVLIYGSRAKGTHHPRSDIDLALFGQMDRHQLARIQLELEETDLPWSFDLLSYNELRHQRLKAHIDRVGKTLYQRAH